jgi:hypothetical protein
METLVEEETNFGCETCEDSGYSCSDCGCPNCEGKEGYCECCAECGETPEYCNCYCGECGELRDGCGCSDGFFGESVVAPWEQRGHNVISFGATSNWSSVWPNLMPGDVDPVMEAANFYLLEALSNGIIGDVKIIDFDLEVSESDLQDFKVEDVDSFMEKRNQYVNSLLENDPLMKLSVEAKKAAEYLASRVEVLDKIFVEYFHVACAGEARHHRAIGNRILDGPGHRNRAWAGWRKVYEAVGNEAVKDLADLFDEFNSDSYGGPKWAEAAMVLYNRLENKLGPTDLINKKMFIDRVWTLEHNGGCFLNKLEWAILNSKKYSISEIKSQVLDIHASHEPSWKKLFILSDDETQKIALSYWNALNEYREINNLEPNTDFLFKEVATLCSWCGKNMNIGHGHLCQESKVKEEKIFDSDFLEEWNEFVVFDQNFNLLEEYPNPDFNGIKVRNLQEFIELVKVKVDLNVSFLSQRENEPEPLIKCHDVTYELSLKEFINKKCYIKKFDMKSGELKYLDQIRVKCSMSFVLKKDSKMFFLTHGYMNFPVEKDSTFKISELTPECNLHAQYFVDKLIKSAKKGVNV